MRVLEAKLGHYRAKFAQDGAKFAQDCALERPGAKTH